MSAIFLPLPADQIRDGAADCAGDLLDPCSGVIEGESGADGDSDLDPLLAGDLGHRCDAEVLERYPVQPREHEDVIELLREPGSIWIRAQVGWCTSGSREAHGCSSTAA